MTIRPATFWISGLVSIFLLPIVAYVMVACTPIEDAIARKSPADASWFEPIFFNYGHTFTDGLVLQFHVGMSAAEVLQTLRTNYAGKGDAIENCEGRQASSLVPLTDTFDIPRLSQERMLCVYLNPRTSLDFHFDLGQVKSIRVSFIRFEGT
jgi:hypothetical protein